MTGGLWALIMLAALAVGFLYWLRVPRKLQKLGDPHNRTLVVRTEDHLEAKPHIDEAERPGGPYDRAEASVERTLRTGPPDQSPPDR